MGDGGSGERHQVERQDGQGEKGEAGIVLKYKLRTDTQTQTQTSLVIETERLKIRKAGYLCFKLNKSIFALNLASREPQTART